MEEWISNERYSKSGNHISNRELLQKNYSARIPRLHTFPAIIRHHKFPKPLSRFFYTCIRAKAAVYIIQIVLHKIVFIVLFHNFLQLNMNQQYLKYSLKERIKYRKYINIKHRFASMHLGQE